MECVVFIAYHMPCKAAISESGASYSTICNLRAIFKYSVAKSAEKNG